MVKKTIGVDAPAPKYHNLSPTVFGLLENDPKRYAKYGAVARHGELLDILCAFNRN